MFKYNPLECLPSSEELLDSDDTPVDNELQILIPSLLLTTLATIWKTRDDWFFGINMGLYYSVNEPAIVPDGFLSLGVERFVGENGRLSYVLWEEDGIPPILALEIIFKTYNSEYEQKKAVYAELGILYYVVYTPTCLSRKHKCLEFYRLVNEEYILQTGDKFWMPEIGLGIRRERGTYLGITREWLFWYDENGDRYSTPDEVRKQLLSQKEQQLSQKEQQLSQKEQQLQELLNKLQERGIDPNTL